jgi:spore germination cell wall hydrolase CwlJ-like protein
MLAHKFGLKTLYYSLINKQGSKGQDDEEATELEVIDFDESEEDCLACKL